MTVKHGIREVEYTKIIQLHVFFQVNPESSGRNAKVMLVDEYFWAILSLTAGKQKCCWTGIFFYQATLSLFSFSLCEVMVNTRSKVLRITFHSALLMENHVLGEAFSYAVCIDCSLFM